MIQKKARTNVFMAAATLLLTLCLIGISKGESDAKKSEVLKDRTIVARVNDEPIYRDVLAPYAEQELKKFKKFGMTRKVSPEVMSRMEKKALNKVIDWELLTQESRHVKIEDIEKKVNEKIEELKIKYKDEENYRKYLESKNITEDALRENFKEGLFVDKYLEEKGIQNPEIPEEEIMAYYEETKENYRRKEYVRASHILIKVDENGPEEEKDKARKRAEQVLKEIKESKDFAAAARKYSEDNRAVNGGNLDYITRGYMPPEFDRAAFAMNKNEVSGVVETKYGFHIIKVYDKRPAGITPYEEVRDFVRKYLQKELSKKRLISHMKELRTKAKIEVLIN